MDKAGRYILWFIAICTFQILVFNNINLGGFINPYIYPLFIFILPFAMAPWLQVLLAFLTGLTIDVFAGTMGMHAAAATMVGFIRPTAINLITQRGVDPGYNPGIYHQGVGWFTSYASILILVHHTFYFIVESWGMSHFGYTLLKIVASTLISTLFVVMLEMLFNSREKGGL